MQNRQLTLLALGGAAIALLILAPIKTAQAQPAKSVTRWEYMTYSIPTKVVKHANSSAEYTVIDHAKVIDLLNSYGAQGWEVVPGAEPIHLLRRQKQ